MAKNKIRDRLIHWLGGYTREEVRIRDARIAELPRQAGRLREYRASIRYYVDAVDRGGNREAKERAEELLADKLGKAILADGLARLHLAAEPNQDGQPVKLMRMTATVWAAQREGGWE